MSLTALNEPVEFQCEGVTGLEYPASFCGAYATPPTSDALTFECDYTAPSVHAALTFCAEPGKDTASATGTIVFGASANAGVLNTKAQATGAMVFGTSAQASVLRGPSASGPIAFTGTAAASRILGAQASALIQFGAVAEANIGQKPAPVTGITHSATSASLTFEWFAADRADDYTVRLYRDAVLVDSEITENLTATFEGLEDGTLYEVEVQGVNETGTGPSGTRQTRTLYIFPLPPTNLRKLVDGFFLLTMGWDPPSTKTTFYQSKIILEKEGEPDRVLYDEVLPPTPTEVVYILPYAETEYRWRLRAGNPSGLSVWVDFVFSTAGKFCGGPDSRGAIPPAAYQEDYLFPDTWDGGTNLISEGVGDPQDIYGGVEFFRGDQFITQCIENAEAFEPKQVNVGQILTSDHLVVVDMRPLWSIPGHPEALNFVANEPNEVGVGNIYTYNSMVQLTGPTENADPEEFEIGAGDINTVLKLYIYNHLSELHIIEYNVGVGDITTE
jgi:hypothetical protein